jgi:hypothetical protein
MLACNDTDDLGAVCPPSLMSGLCAIISRELDRQGISSRLLADVGIVRRRQGFRERLASVQLLPSEIDALVRYLEIDMVRVTIAFEVFGEPESYFDALTHNLGNVCRALKGSVERQGDALDCAFEPMRPALCDAVADRICQALVQHHARVEQARSALL